jgi:hypothetical protein
MRVGVAADHGGFELKGQLIELLKAAGYEVVDFGAFALALNDDYPDYIAPMAKAVASGEVERGSPGLGALCRRWRRRWNDGIRRFVTRRNAHGKIRVHRREHYQECYGLAETLFSSGGDRN